MGKLSGKDVAFLTNVLSKAVNADELASVVYAATGDRLYVEFVAPGLPLKVTIQRLLEALEEAGTTPQVLAGIIAIKPHRPDVKEKILSVCPEAADEAPASNSEIQVQKAGQPQADGPNKASAPGFERNVRPNLAQLDVQVWLGKLQRIERQVCRVETNGNAAGTGFLVGPDAVITNWHVVEAAKTAGAMSTVTCRFDYLRLADGSRQPGLSVELAEEACVSYRRYAPAEVTKTPGVPMPTSDELDYALLRLARPLGNDDAGGGRGWIRLPDVEMPMKEGDPLIIVQHPDGSPMKLALDTDAVLSVNENRTRVKYATNTESGSSGSPVFTLDWELVALHHFGDPAWLAPAFNQGVPAQLIKRKILDDGRGNLLGS